MLCKGTCGTKGLSKRELLLACLELGHHYLPAITSALLGFQVCWLVFRMELTLSALAVLRLSLRLNLYHCLP